MMPAIIRIPRGKISPKDGALFMNGKERLTRACLGKDIDRVPWTPMLFPWFHIHKYHDSLPDELSNCETCLDALRVMRADLFAKHEVFIVHASYTHCNFSSSFSGKNMKKPLFHSCLMDVFGYDGGIKFEGKLEKYDVIDTPKGPLTCSWVFDETAGAPYEKKHYWEDFEEGYEKILCLLQDIEFEFKPEDWYGVLTDLGDDGIAHLRIPPTPLKILHWLAGPEKATYYLIDHPDKVMELVRIYEDKVLDLVKRAVKLAETLVFTSGDNMDSMMYSPPIFEDYCGHSFRNISTVLHNEGKLLFTHACGQLADVIKLCADSGVDGMEGMAPPPVGNLNFADAREMLGSGFVLQGGMTCNEEELDGPDKKEKIFQRVCDIFTPMKDKKSFIFSSGCAPTSKAIYENFLTMRDACWKYGTM